jgi:hypothetical protein
MVWEWLAALATTAGQEHVQASSRYVALKLGAQLADRTVAELMSRMHRLELVTLVNKRAGTRQVHQRGADWFKQREDELGITSHTEAARAKILRESFDYALYLNEWADGESMVAEVGPR